MIEITKLNKDIATKLKNKRLIEKINESSSLLSKLIPVIVFISTIYGAFQLFGFSREYNINFLDVAKTNIILTYGILFFILAIVLVMLPFSVILWNNYFGRFTYKYFIQHFKYKTKKKYRTLLLILIYATLSLWPLIFLLESSRFTLYFFIIIPIVVITYLILFTKKVKFNFTIDYFFKEVCKKIGSVAIICFPLYIGMIALLFIVEIERHYLSNFSEKWILLTAGGVFFGFSYFPVILATNKNLSKRSSPFYFIVFVYCLFILSFHSPFLIADKVANVTGLGHSKRCYLKEGLDAINIPPNYQENTSVSGIVKLSVVANIDDIYYLAIPKHEVKKATLKFKNSNLKKINCPE